jgi:hypothetical protein
MHGFPLFSLDHLCSDGFSQFQMQLSLSSATLLERTVGQCKVDVCNLQIFYRFLKAFSCFVPLPTRIKSVSFKDSKRF